MTVFWQELAQHVLNLFNVLTIAYFFAGNGVYTLLMVVSLAYAFVYNRRLSYHGLQELRESGVTPPVTVIIPAHDEEDSILGAVRSVLQADYPDVRILIVDDGSQDSTLARLVREFHLLPMDLIYRNFLSTQPVKAFYCNPDFPGLVALSKEHGGKADALNAGINFCRTPYFCTLDADCLLEPDAMLRLMRPVVRSPENMVVSGGIIRIRNGCKTARGRVQEVRLPSSWLERLQVVEYLRSFLFGRAGWDLMKGTLIVSGALALFDRQAVLDAGGFSGTTVGEDMELVVRLYRWAERQNRPIRISFTTDTVCWTECPSTFKMLARQRRRWQLGLCQTLWMNSEMLFNRKYGAAGMVSFPFHFYIEALGTAVEFIGYLIVPLAFMLHLALSAFYIPLVVLSLVYASFLSVGAVLLEELTYRRYPRRSDLYILLGGALLENFGFRQLILYYRFQGFVQFLAGLHRWEKVRHTADSPASSSIG